MSCVSIVEAEYHASLSTSASFRSSPQISQLRNTALSASYRSSSGSVDVGSYSVEAQLDELRTARSMPAFSPALEDYSSDLNALSGINYPVQLVTATTPYEYPLDYSWANPWPKPPVVPNDAQRVQVLRSYPILDDGSVHSYGFGAICDFAAQVLRCPVAVVTVIDEKYVRFQASVGLAQDKIPRSVAFCAHALVSKEPTVVLDTTVDTRFLANPMVTGAGIHFYASAPICAPSGHVLGTVCVMDQSARPLGVDVSLLEVLANVVVKKLEDSERRRLPSTSSMRRSSEDRGASSSQDGGKGTDSGHRRRSTSSSSSTATRSHRTSSSDVASSSTTNHPPYHPPYPEDLHRVSSVGSSVAAGGASRDSSMGLTDGPNNNQPPQQQQFFLAPDELKPRTQWVSDSKRHDCQVCNRKFSMFLRKHHCRVCGEVICKNCAMSTMLVKRDKKVPITACLDCLRSRTTDAPPLPPNSHSTRRRRPVDGDTIILHPHGGSTTSPEADNTLEGSSKSSPVDTPVATPCDLVEPEPAEIIPVLLRYQAYDVDTNLAMYSNHELVLDSSSAVAPVARDFSQQEIQSMLVRLLSQSNDIQHQIAQVAPPLPASSRRSVSR
ncbi:hypothetical protein DYB34_003545 [Aphanomyces astaci]|uniref:FYVE-type domain-containing protein n=1 Tax=Aphanomyces astaci TaxID=112090 RepID=A0A418BDF7_APHAT|nr:hypothetical protein DYB34_003545 [Aphanomyces astaci]